MEKKTDLRIIKTRINIQSTFLRLLNNKRFEEITIQNILDTALVNRSTFYKHYMDKYQLASVVTQEAFEELQSYIDNVFVMRENGVEMESVAIFIADMLDKLGTRKRDLLTLFKIRTDDADLYDSLLKYLKKKYIYFFTNICPDNKELTDYNAELYANMVIVSFCWLLQAKEPVDMQVFLSHLFLMFESVFRAMEFQNKSHGEALSPRLFGKF